MVASSGFLTVPEFADKVAELPTCTDVVVQPSWRFELTERGVEIGDMRVGALPLYQVKSLVNGAVNLSGFSRLESRALDDDEAAARIRYVCQVLNEGLNGHPFDTKPLTARSYLTHAGTQVLGGIVTEKYTPLTHLEVVERMMDVGALVEHARIDGYDITVSRVSVTMLVGDQKWAVDGGLKAGMSLGNGQFGDKAFKVAAMLFRLLCTNGMMDVVDGETFRSRHTGDHVDLASALARVMDRSDRIFGAAKESMDVIIDVVNTLIDLHRRGILGRGPLRKALERRSEVMGGRLVEGSGTTLWGLSQSITAAARDYSFNQRESLGKLAGRLVFEGYDRVVADRPIPVGAPTEEEVREEFVLEAA